MEKNKKGRPPTKKVDLKEGFYIELRSKESGSPVKLRKDNMFQVEQAFRMYEASKIVTYLGEVKAGKWVDGKNKGKKTDR